MLFFCCAPAAPKRTAGACFLTRINLGARGLSAVAIPAGRVGSLFGSFGLRLQRQLVDAFEGIFSVVAVFDVDCNWLPDWPDQRSVAGVGARININQSSGLRPTGAVDGYNWVAFLGFPSILEVHTCFPFVWFLVLVLVCDYNFIPLGQKQFQIRGLPGL